MLGLKFGTTRRNNVTDKIKKISPLKAIRAKCLDCCCKQAREVALCPADDCSLFSFRFGRNPNRAGMGPRMPAFLKKAKHNTAPAEQGEEMVSRA